MSALTDLSLAELSREIRARRVSPVEATEACLARLEAQDGTLNSFLTVTAEPALEGARQLEAELVSGGWRGPLHGVPLALKDLFLTAGVRTTAGSAILRDWVPSHDASVVRYLQAAGAVFLGKLNMHEFAFGATSVNPHYGAVRNPRDPARLAGGSSGGSAAAVAAGLCFGALGTDTGGSIRCPAALCGIVGLKPTYGRVSRAGVLPLSWSLDHVGPMTRTVADAALMLEAISGHDPGDSTSSRQVVPSYSRLLDGGVKGLRLGVPREFFWDEADAEVLTVVRNAIRDLEKVGAEVREVSLPSLRYLAAAQSLIIHAEAGAYHREYLRTRSDEYGRSVRTRLIQGLFVNAADYLAAQRVRAQVRREFLDCLQDVDALVTPTVPITAPRLDQSVVSVPGLEALPQYFLVRNTAPFNFTGLPALSVPCGQVAGLPVGLQIAGRPWEEATVLRIGRAVEEINGE